MGVGTWFSRNADFTRIDRMRLQPIWRQRPAANFLASLGNADARQTCVDATQVCLTVSTGCLRLSGFVGTAGEAGAAIQVLRQKVPPDCRQHLADWLGNAAPWPKNHLAAKDEILMSVSDSKDPGGMPRKDYFVAFSSAVSNWAGKPLTFATALLGIIIWAVLGPILNYSESWQLVVNTSTTIITFLMIFVLQNSQNRDGKALQVKLDELILSNSRAENRFIGAEALGEADMVLLRKKLDAKRLTIEEWSESLNELSDDLNNLENSVEK